MAAPKPIWVRQAEEAKLKSEADTAAAAKAAFDATFKALTSSSAAADEPNRTSSSPPSSNAAAADDSDDDADDDRHDNPPGPTDPSKSSAAGPGIAGGAAGAPATFTVVAKDRDSRRVPHGGAHVRVRVAPGAGVGGSDLDGVVKDNGDGSYAVTYVVPKRGNYMVHVEIDGLPVMGSPFPVFFSASTSASTSSASFPTNLSAASSVYPNMVNQTMPNMPNYAGAVSGAFPGLLSLIPGAVSTGAGGGVVLQGVGASLGEICREHLNGRCTKTTTECRFSHPPQQLLMSVLAATTSMGALSQAPMAPSAAAMAAAQAIMAAQALQAHAAKMQAEAKSSEESSGSLDKADQGDALKKLVQVSNLSPLLTVDHLKQLFGYCGKVVDCTISDTKHFAYVEYSKPEEATAALALNNMDVGGRPLNVEMAKSLPPKSSLANSDLPVMMQQAVQLQQMQFQQALLMQQAIASQQAAARAATMKSATEAAAARAAEISRKLKAEGLGGDNGDEKDAKKKSRSPSPPPRRSKSRSRSPIKYRRSRRSRSYSSPVRHSRDHRSRSPTRSYHSKYGGDRSYRDERDKHSRSGRREHDRSRDHYSSSSRRNRSRSTSPRYKKSSRTDSRSPKRHRESLSPSKSARSVRDGSRSPRHHKGKKSSPTREHHSSHHSRHSRSRSQERKQHNSDKKDSRKSDMQDDKRRSNRSSRGDKVEMSSRDSKEDKKVETSAVAHKRSISVSEDEILNSEKSSHKKSKHDTSLEIDERKDEGQIEDGVEMTEDKRLMDSPRSKSQKRSVREVDNNHNQNNDTSRHSKTKSDYKKYDRDYSSRKERKHAADEPRHSRDDRASHRSSSRSHRSSRHSRERYYKDAKDQHKSKKSEEGVAARKHDSSLEEPFSSDKMKQRIGNSPNQNHNESATGLYSDGNLHDTESAIDGGKTKVDGKQHLEVPLQSASLEESDLAMKGAKHFAHGTNGCSVDEPSADVLFPASSHEDHFPIKEDKENVYSTEAEPNGQHGLGVEGAVGDSN